MSRSQITKKHGIRTPTTYRLQPKTSSTPLAENWRGRKIDFCKWHPKKTAHLLNRLCLRQAAVVFVEASLSPIAFLDIPQKSARRLAPEAPLSKAHVPSRCNQKKHKQNKSGETHFLAFVVKILIKITIFKKSLQTARKTTP